MADDYGEYCRQLVCDGKRAARIFTCNTLAALGDARTGNLFHQRFPQFANFGRFR